MTRAEGRGQFVGSILKRRHRVGMRIWENSEEIKEEFRAVAKWIDEELAGMVLAYKEKNIKILGNEAHDYEFVHDAPLSLTSENETKISTACKNVHFADTYFELMETEFARFLINFEEIEEDEEDKEDKIEDIEED